MSANEKLIINNEKRKAFDKFVSNFKAITLSQSEADICHHLGISRLKYGVIPIEAIIKYAEPRMIRVDWVLGLI